MQSQVPICMQKTDLYAHNTLLYGTDFLRSRVQSNFQLTFSYKKKHETQIFSEY